MLQTDTVPDPFQVGNVHYVDSLANLSGTGRNYLFRGSLPLIDNQDGTYTFNTPGLKQAILQAAAKAGVQLPEIYRIRDINLLQWENGDEVPRIMTEYAHFAAYPDAGEFMFWETRGTELCPLDRPFSDPGVRDALALNLDGWLGDQLLDRTEKLRAFLENDPVPTVTYVHCEGGDDRTGEMMAAYYMSWMNMSWSSVNEINKIIAGRPFGCNNFRAALWYAIYLNLTTGSPTDFMKQFPCDNNGTFEIACPDLLKSGKTMESQSSDRR
jgi:hypothetical protein